MLAEVSDKIPSAAFFWCFHLAAALPFPLLACLSGGRIVRLLLLLLAPGWGRLLRL